MTGAELQRRDEDAFALGKVFAESGMFPNIRKEGEAIVKIVAGREFGLGPMAAMQGIHMVDGKPTLSANLIAGQIKRHPGYDYRVVRREEDGCTLEFFELRGASRTKLGSMEFTKADATRAGLTGKQNWKKYPRDMMFARALTAGARTFCPDVLGGSPIYTAEELGHEDEPERMAVNPDMSDSQATVPVEPEPEAITDAEVVADPTPTAEGMTKLRALFTASGQTPDWLMFKLVELGVDVEQGEAATVVPAAMGKLTLDQGLHLAEALGGDLLADD